MNDYEVGSSHPNLHPNESWYFCHPSIGIQPISVPFSMPEKVIAWRSHIAEDEADEAEESFTRQLVKSFTDFNPDSILTFYGGHEASEMDILNEAGMESRFKGKWTSAFHYIVTSVNVHEFTLTANSSKLVIYEDWSNIFLKFGDDNFFQSFNTTIQELIASL